jgi:predicted NAD/FAD-dependent oxidoreductase
VKIAVVGAGVAGLSAARRLASAGAPVVVFEKARGAGGRAATRRADGLAFDHGAQYFTSRDPGFGRLVREWAEAGLVAEWTGRIGVLEAGAVRPVPPGTKRWVGVPGMSALARALAPGLDLRFGTRVEEVRRDAGRWQLLSDGGADLGRFDGVVVAVPAPQAVPLLAHEPSLAEAAALARMRPCWAALVAFDSVLDLPVDGAFLPGPALAWAARNGAKPGRPPGETWVLHAAPAWSESRLEEAPEAVLKSLLAAFGAEAGRPMPAVRHAVAHRWRFALPEPALDAPFLFDRARGLGAAGDWCGGPRIEGAFLSGLRLAEAMLGA